MTRRRRYASAALALAGGLLACTASAAPVPARRIYSPSIRAENALPGTATWRIQLAPERSIEGYASEVSMQPGEAVHFHVSTVPAARYRIEVYRLGWYGGVGGRRIACIPSCTTDRQGSSLPLPPFDPSNGYLNAGWPMTDSFTTPKTWLSGYYLANLVLMSGEHRGKGSWVPFIVRASAGAQSAILVRVPVNTWQAYNNWGGKSLYSEPYPQYTHVSFDRPYGLEGFADGQFGWEIGLLHFLEREGYDVSYTTDVDTDREPGELLRHRLVMTAGHGEYWTKGIRDALERAQSLGTNLAFMGANTGYWQIRYEADRRTIVEYRLAAADPEPDPALKTTWFYKLVPPRPECELLGVAFQEGIGGGDRDFHVNPAALGDPWLAGTGFTSDSVLAGLVGGEWDAVKPDCAVPPPTVFFHYEGQPTNADAVRYTAPSGARVFSAGSLKFSWGLDGEADLDRARYEDRRLEQFFRNALDDLTRPAAPVAVAVHRTRRPLRVRIVAQRRVDPRVHRLLVFRHAGSAAFAPASRGASLVCDVNARQCLDKVPRPGTFRYAVAAADRWGTSPPLLSRPITVR